MKILVAMTGKDPDLWLPLLRGALPDAEIRSWADGDDLPADYALVWKPAPEVLTGRVHLKAIVNMGAGVDAMLDLHCSHPGAIPEGVPIYRLEDAGMAIQMVEYATYATLRHFRSFDEYEFQRRERLWQPLSPRVASDVVVGVMGLGSLGAAVASRLALLGMEVRGYSRSHKSIDGVLSFSGTEQFESFLHGVHVLINLLPNTADTRNVLGKGTFSLLGRGAYIVNLARGVHLVENDLLDAIHTGQVAGAMLDVFREEPLPASHPFWDEHRITITPHISAQTMPGESVRQVAEKIRAIEDARVPTGRVDLCRGY
ncbi:2-hydroxyacid dehydrogenase [Caballeronia arvi]|uniref:2-hydroxyacid dehydrogenase n=1 Tax=Caballeronia arvi TaxID=1777135 RepID=A0A158KI22_9BURK|nr:glyoxylate/hydroxypyruvate reductase A [Caballeronia arvi]SAL80788.1 2-hydroxyacid dehydrogenase [Caballeronia arvi]